MRRYATPRDWSSAPSARHARSCSRSGASACRRHGASGAIRDLRGPAALARGAVEGRPLEPPDLGHEPRGAARLRRGRRIRPALVPARGGPEVRALAATARPCDRSRSDPARPGGLPRGVQSVPLRRSPAPAGEPRRLRPLDRRGPGPRALPGRRPVKPAAWKYRRDYERPCRECHRPIVGAARNQRLHDQCERAGIIRRRRFRAQRRMVRCAGLSGPPKEMER